MTDPAALLEGLLAAARAAGADSADAMYVAGTDLSVQRRLGRIEHLERSEARDLGLRVFLGQRSAVVSTTGLNPAEFPDLAERAMAMARVVPEDPFGFIPEASGRSEDAARMLFGRALERLRGELADNNGRPDGAAQS